MKCILDKYTNGSGFFSKKEYFEHNISWSFSTEKAQTPAQNTFQNNPWTEQSNVNNHGSQKAFLDYWWTFHFS